MPVALLLALNNADVVNGDVVASPATRTSGASRGSGDCCSTASRSTDSVTTASERSQRSHPVRISLRRRRVGRWPRDLEGSASAAVPGRRCAVVLLDLRHALRPVEKDGHGTAGVHRKGRRDGISRREYGVRSAGRRDSRLGDAASAAPRVRGRRHRACRDPRRRRRFRCGNRLDHQPRWGTRVSRGFRFDARAARLAAQRRP